MICPRCGHPHTEQEWDELFTDWKTFFQTKRGLDASKAFDAAHRELKKHGPRPGGPVGEGDRMKKAWEWFNGKKTLIASIFVGVPLIWDIIDDMLIAGGIPEAKVLAIGGSLLLIVGWGHKIMKALGMAKEPEKK